MFDKHTIYPRGGFNANRVHRQGYNKDDNEYHVKDTNYITAAKEGTRRMFNEWAIEAKADSHYGNGPVNVGDSVKINKRRPYSTYYKYGLIK